MSLEKVTNWCYLVMSSAKILLHKSPTLWSKILSCKLFNSWNIQKIRQLQNCNQGLQPPLPKKLRRPVWPAFFLPVKPVESKGVATSVIFSVSPKNRHFSSKIFSNSLFSKGLFEKRLFGTRSING